LLDSLLIALPKEYLVKQPIGSSGHVFEQKRDSSRKEAVAEGNLVRAGSPAACRVP